MTARRARFNVGQIVSHRRAGYRGVVYDVDPSFSLDDAWYDEIARSRPPKDKPWYSVLVDGGEHTTYVAERHLERSDDDTAIHNPLVEDLFAELRDGSYVPRDRHN